MSKNKRRQLTTLYTGNIPKDIIQKFLSDLYCIVNPKNLLVNSDTVECYEYRGYRAHFSGPHRSSEWPYSWVIWHTDSPDERQLKLQFDIFSPETGRFSASCTEQEFLKSNNRLMS